jgi:hypothetical protein
MITPGQWRASYDGERWRVLSDEGVDDVLVPHIVVTCGHHACAEADANLIALAPELFQENEAFKKDIEDYREYHRFSRARIAQLETAIRAAIDDIESHDEGSAYATLKHAMRDSEVCPGCGCKNGDNHRTKYPSTRATCEATAERWLESKSS